MVSIVDLRYMLEYHCLSARPSLYSVHWGPTVVISNIFRTQDGDYQSTTIIYRSFILV